MICWNPLAGYWWLWFQCCRPPVNIHFIKPFKINIPVLVFLSSWWYLRSSLMLCVCNDPLLHSSLLCCYHALNVSSHHHWSRKWSTAEVSLSHNQPAAINFIKMLFVISLLTHVLILRSITYFSFSRLISLMDVSRDWELNSEKVSEPGLFWSKLWRAVFRHRCIWP